MKSILGFLAGLAAAAAVAAAYAVYARPHAGWLDAQWLFLVALPYNWTMLSLTGSSDFTPDAPGQIAAAAAFDVAGAYVAGAIVEAIARRLLRPLFRLRPRA